jgi:toxin-antitoxin system PIN domain toxin
VKLPDVNVLVYAHRKEHAHHRFYSRWLEDLVNGDAPFAISSLAAIGMVRVVTHSKFPNGPTPLSHAFEQMAALIEEPNCRFIGPEGTHWVRVQTLCQATKTSGAKITDAQHAAIAMEHGCTLVSRDPDFERFVSHGLDFELLEPG